MRNLFLSFFLTISCLCFSKENEWHNSWLKGLKLIDNEKYEEAKEAFISALSEISKQELQEIPEVLIYLAQTHYMLEDFEQVLAVVNSLLERSILSDQQRMGCGNLLISSLWKQERKEEAIEAYKKYIINSPMAPKCHFTDDHIIITNVPSCTTYENVVKNFLINEFCSNPEDFHGYGNIWILETTKKCKCQQIQLPSKRAENKKRNPEATAIARERAIAGKISAVS